MNKEKGIKWGILFFFLAIVVICASSTSLFVENMATIDISTLQQKCQDQITKYEAINNNIVSENTMGNNYIPSSKNSISGDSNIFNNGVVNLDTNRL